MATLPHVSLHDVSSVRASALDKASDLASAAAERIEDLPERVVELAAVAIPALRPKPRRSKRPLLLLAIVIAAVAAGWLWRRRTATGPSAVGATVGAAGEPAVSAAS
jgi:hypothetical protein